MTIRSIVLASLLMLLLTLDAHAAVLCGFRAHATGLLREGATLRVRTACRKNEVEVDPEIFGGAASADTISFTTETVIGGSVTLHLGPGGRIGTDEAYVRTPIGGGTLRGLRCYVPEAPGGGGLDVTLGVGDCGAPLTYDEATTIVFAPHDGPVAKDSGAAAVPLAEGQCVALRVRLLGTTNHTVLNCTVERHPG